MKQFTLFLVVLLGMITPVTGQNDLLQSGPMVGYSTMKEVLLWVQTTRPAQVQFQYVDTEAPEQVLKTAMVSTSAEDAYVAKMVAAVGH